jgi:phospholipid transport system substrate-binding protein
MTTRRLAALALAMPLAVGLFPAPALRAGPAQAQANARDIAAEQFVQVQANRALQILNDRALSTAEKTRAFRAFVDQNADVAKITTFVLGKYARTITPAQRARFAAVFREYASNVYESRLGDYHGETLKVTGSVIRRPRDTIVNSLVEGGQQKTPTAVAWRILGSAGAYKVVDVQVAGVWLAITEQQDFVSTIDNAGGNIDVLIGQLEAKVRAERR